MSRALELIKAAVELKEMPTNDRTDILQKYVILADSHYNHVNDKIIEANSEVYDTICNPMVCVTLFMDRKLPYYTSFAVDNPLINKLFSSSAEMMSVLKGYCSDPGRVVSLSDIRRSLATFGLEVATEDDIADADVIDTGDVDGDDIKAEWDSIEDAFGSSEEGGQDWDFDDITDDMIDDGDSDGEDGLGENETSSAEEEIEAEQELDDGDEEEIEAEQESEQASEPDNNIEEEDDDEAKIEKLRSAWGESIDNVVDSIMTTYTALYSSGYGLVSPSGILTNIGIIKSTSDGLRKETGNKSQDIKIYRALQSVLGDRFDYYAPMDTEPDIEVIMKNNMPIIYTDMHLKFMFGHLNFCKGRKTGLRAYLTKNGIKNDSDIKVLKYNDIKGWIHETVERYFYESYVKLGVTDKMTPDDFNKADAINEALSKNLKNVIVVAERKAKVNTKLRICTDSVINVDAVIKALKSSLNVGTSSSIRVDKVGEYNNGILELNIVYDDKKYSQDVLFAYQVLDILEEQGIKPRWDNVILGKKEDGTIMTYNFKNKKSPTYALYASSRSGKGVMTLNLIASALADGCKLLYIDGKPDMACVLGDVAWKNGLEAAVFNGVAGKGSEVLEYRKTCHRVQKDKDGKITFGPFWGHKQLPNGLFLTKAEKEKFMLITTYLRGLDLLCDMAAHRASIADSLDPNDWLVVVVDECEQASVAESDINDILNRAETERKQAKDEDGKKINLLNDEIYKFIQDYRKWTTKIESKFKTCVTSTFGYANMTNFFVWQSTQFPKMYTGKSSLAKVVDGAAGNIVKIVGRGAAVAYGSTAYGTPNSLDSAGATWYDSKFKGKNGGYFAIGNNVNSNDMEVFRPFNVYSDADHKSLIVENAKTAGMSEEDLIGVQLNADGTVKPEVGFEGYVNLLLGRLGLSAAQQLNVGFEYLDDFIKTSGKAESLLHYMYNTYDFTAMDEDDDELSRSRDESEDVAQGQSQSVPTKGISFSEGAASGDNESAGQAGSADAFGSFGETEASEPGEATGKKPSLSKGMDRSAASDLERATEQRDVTVGIMNARKFNNLDNESKRANIDRIVNEFTHSSFDPFLDGNVAYGIKHLVWNTGILFETGKLGEIVDSLATTESNNFFHNYAIALKNRKYRIDQVPTAEQVKVLCMDASENSERDQWDIYKGEDSGRDFDASGLADGKDEQYGDTFSESDFEESAGNSGAGERQIPSARQSSYTEQGGYGESFGDDPSDFSEEEEERPQRKNNPFVYNSMQPDLDVEREIFVERKAGRNNINVNNLRVPVIALDNNNFVQARPVGGIAEMFKASMYESMFGTSYMFKRRCDKLIKAIQRSFPRSSMVNRIIIKDYTLVVNGRMVDTDPFVDDLYGVRFEDFVIVKQLLKEFKMVTELTLDNMMFNQVVLDYGDTAQKLWVIFQENSKLQILNVQLEPGAEFLRVTRNDYQDNLRRIQDAAMVSKKKQEIEYVAASVNNKRFERGSGYMNGVMRIAKERKDKAAGNMRRSNLVGGVFNMGLAGVIVGFGALAGILALPSRLIKRNS